MVWVPIILGLLLGISTFPQVSHAQGGMDLEALRQQAMKQQQDYAQKGPEVPPTPEEVPPPLKEDEKAALQAINAAAGKKQGPTGGGNVAQKEPKRLRENEGRKGNEDMEDDNEDSDDARPVRRNKPRRRHRKHFDGMDGGGGKRRFGPGGGIVGDSIKLGLGGLRI